MVLNDKEFVFCVVVGVLGVGVGYSFFWMIWFRLGVCILVVKEIGM